MRFAAPLLVLILLVDLPLANGCSSGSKGGTGNGMSGAAASGTDGSGTSGGAMMAASGSSGSSSSGVAGGGANGSGASSGDGLGVSGSSGSAGTGSSGALGGSGNSGTGSSGSGGTPEAGPDSASGSGTRIGPDSGPVDTSKKITVWLAGDSTMQPCATPCPCGWGSQFQPYFNGNATVVDNAAGGRSIQTWLYESNVTMNLANGECVLTAKTYSARWQAMLDPTNGMKPGDYLFVEFGINDQDTTCPRHVGTALFQTYLGDMAQAAQSRGAHPIFLTSTSAIQCMTNMAIANRAFGPETRAAGMANNVPVIDLTQLSAAFYTSLGLCPNDANYASTTTPLGKFFCNDHTHFEASGASQIAGVVAKALRDQNIGLAAYLK